MGDLENCRHLGKNARYAPAFSQSANTRLAPTLESGVKDMYYSRKLGRTKTKVTISFICMKRKKRLPAYSI